MRLPYIFALILTLLAATVAAGVCLYDGVHPQALYLYIGLPLAAAIALVIFYRRATRPIRSLLNGIYLLRGQDFGSRLRRTGQPEADEIIDMFNRMMGSLKEKRVRIREQNHLLDLISEVSPMAIILLDDHDRITSANPAAAEFLGAKDATTLSGVSLAALDSGPGPVLASLQQGQTQTVRLNDSMVYRCSRLTFMDNGYAHHFLLIVKLTEEILLAERHSYEKVIRVIAHEVNNSMASVTSILSSASQMLGEEGGNADMRELVDVCAARCRDMSRFITSYADVVKIPAPVRRPADLNELIESWRIGLESLCRGADVALEVHLSPEPVKAGIDPVLLEQAVINIVKNAVESIGNAGGTVTLTTETHPRRLIIADNGKGISDEEAGHLFSPFYTTKPDGHGIGLMLVREVLTGHGFQFSLATGPDGLTRFTINL